MDVTRLLERADALILQGEHVLATAHHIEHYGDHVDPSLMAGFRAAGLSFINTAFDNQHPYYTEFDQNSSGDYLESAGRSLQIIQQVRLEIEGGWVVSLESLISADIFSGLIEQAEYLHESGYSVASAVTAGSALEAHLKKLAENQGIELQISLKGRFVSKKADVINADLVKAGVYTKLEQKMVTAWLGIRNEAAHGNENGFTSD